MSIEALIRNLYPNNKIQVFEPEAGVTIVTVEDAYDELDDEYYDLQFRVEEEKVKSTAAL